MIVKKEKEKEPFKWFDVNEVLPEDVMEHHHAQDDSIISERTGMVIVRFINKSRGNEIHIIQGYRCLSRMFNPEKKWKWHFQWYDRLPPMNERDAEITHWAYIPDVD